jgi:hypothetical protein
MNASRIGAFPENILISIFQSQNIRVDRINDFGSQVCLVSFTERKTYRADLAEQGFGQDFARKNSIDGFYVKCIGITGTSIARCLKR